MADKKHKSQAEKVAASKSYGKKTTKTGKNEIKSSDVPKERAIPVRLISSAIFFSLFVVFLIISLYPEGGPLLTTQISSQASMLFTMSRIPSSATGRSFTILRISISYLV